MIRAGLHDVACELRYSTRSSVMFAFALPVVLRFRRQYPLTIVYPADVRIQGPPNSSVWTAT